MYKKYRAKGVEVLALDFEQGDEVQDPVRMPAFKQRYGIDYTVLLAGASSEINERLPQLNFNAWPTTLFLDKDGRVAHVHAGFPSSASGRSTPRRNRISRRRWSGCWRGVRTRSNNLL